MARPTKRQRQIKQAKELLANETLREIFDARKQEIFERWQASQTTELREACWYEFTALEGLNDGIYALGNDTE
jgi:hypothetical protein